LAAKDDAFAALIAAVGPCTALRASTRSKTLREVTPFQALAESIAYQQLNGKAAQTIWGRVLKLSNGRPPSPASIIKTPSEALRAAGLSRAKVLAIQDLAAKTIEGVVPTRRQALGMSDAELIELITQVRGIGPWTVQMFLIFTLQRPDVMPETDYGVRNGFSILYRKRRLPTPGELLQFSERWKPYRSYAAWYLWQAVNISNAKR
jgi:3-methyladenine DNA glycosylase/8-oxoguanine DNA glycosylase